MEALDEFKVASGLAPSLPKSTAYFCNVLNYTKLAILRILPFVEGSIPVKYLGVPLVSSRLMIRDCKELIEKVHMRVNDWKNKSLSAAGRLQLVQSVISSSHVYWASVFLLPNRIMLDIEQIMCGFLWCQGGICKGKAKVAWDVVCLPKSEGGLGLRRLECFNKALMISHIWKLLSRKESLWVQWIHTYKLCNRNFWSMPIRGNMSWSWRKILQLRPLIRQHFWYRVGNGTQVSIWYDRWCQESPIDQIVSSRDIFSQGYDLNTKVCDMITDGVLRWPDGWLIKYPILNTILMPNIALSVADRLEWRNISGEVKPFAVKVVWNAIHPRSDKVNWAKVIWFSCCIPRHAFNMWLIIKRRLKTQDKIILYNPSVNNNLVCPLCEVVPYSHEHLFFDCVFSRQIWDHMKVYAGITPTTYSLYDIVQHISLFAKRRTTRSVIMKLVLAATAYFIWQERNGRLFKGLKRMTNQVIDCVMMAVRLKLLSCKMKKTGDGVVLVQLWKISEAIFIS